jgi:hypothetical protein
MQKHTTKSIFKNCFGELFLKIVCFEQLIFSKNVSCFRKKKKKKLTKQSFNLLYFLRCQKH